MKCQQKITLGEMRVSRPQRLLVYCGDYKCAHSVTISRERWPAHVRLSILNRYSSVSFVGIAALMSGRYLKMPGDALS
jgi:hypothetical protein